MAPKKPSVSPPSLATFGLGWSVSELSQTLIMATMANDGGKTKRGIPGSPFLHLREGGPTDGPEFANFSPPEDENPPLSCDKNPKMDMPEGTSFPENTLVEGEP